jgi:hypothetical protein
MVENREVSREVIARRAHELYVQRGSENGRDVEDWLSAEKQLGRQPVGSSAATNRQAKSTRAN